MRKLLLCTTVLGAFVATQSFAAETAKAPKNPEALTETQMDQVVGGAPPTLYTNGNDNANDNSCNSGQCYYVNSNGKEIGKPVRGYNN